MEPDQLGQSGQSAPAYPQAPPVSAEEARRPLTPPAPITVSFWCWLVSALLWLVGGLLIIGQRQNLINALRQANNNTPNHLTDAEIQQAVTVSITGVVVVAVIIAALFALFAFKLRAGRNWARIVLTVIGVLALLDLIVRAHAGTALSYASGILAIVAAVLSYLPRSNAYIAAVKHARRG